MAKGFWKRAFGSVGVNESEYENDFYEDQATEEEQYDYEDHAAEEEPAYEEPSFSARRRSKVIEMPEGRSRVFNRDQIQMLIFRPTSYDETQGLIDNLKDGRTIVVNLDEIDVAIAQRILDFISGAVYALGGDIKKAARNIFVVAPANVEISSNMDQMGGTAGQKPESEEPLY